MPSERILRLPEVLARVGFAESAVRAKVRTGEFPSPVRIGRRALGWRESTISRWLRSRPAYADRRVDGPGPRSD